MILVGNGHIRRRSGKARAHQGLRARRGDSPHDPAAGGTGLRAGWAPALPSPPGCHQAGCIHSLPSGSLADRSPNVTDPRRGNARRSAVMDGCGFVEGLPRDRPDGSIWAALRSAISRARPTPYDRRCPGLTPAARPLGAADCHVCWPAGLVAWMMAECRPVPASFVLVMVMVMAVNPAAS